MDDGAFRRGDLPQPREGEVVNARSVAMVALAVLAVTGPTAVLAQPQNRVSARSAREAAPIDLTGYWVAYVTEN